jgi:hypothetical protein
MIAIDLVVRFAWVVKMWPNGNRFYGLEACIFIVEIAEVLRRGLWVIFRAETEWIRRSYPQETGIELLST